MSPLLRPLPTPSVLSGRRLDKRWRITAAGVRKWVILWTSERSRKQMQLNAFGSALLRVVIALTENVSTIMKRLVLSSRVMSSLMVLKTGRDRQCGTSLSSPLLSSRIRGFLWLCHTRKGLFAASIAQETVTRSVWNAMKREELSAGTVMVVVQLATGMKSGSALLVMDANR